jgi:hypothetical protein
VVLHVVVAGGYPTASAVRFRIRHDPDSVRAPIHGAVNYDPRCSSELVLEAVQTLAELAPETLRICDTYWRIPLHILLTAKVPPVGLVRSLVEARPGSVFSPEAGEEEEAAPCVCFAAANLDASLDVLYTWSGSRPGTSFCDAAAREGMATKVLVLSRLLVQS